MAKDWSKIYNRYRGKWVALKDDETTVVGSGQTAKTALASAQRKGFKQPILFRVPSKLVFHTGLARLYTGKAYPRG